MKRKSSFKDEAYVIGLLALIKRVGKGSNFKLFHTKNFTGESA